MASDDSPEFKASQSKHAENIKARRAIERTFGVTAESARRALQAFSKRTLREEMGPAVRKAEVGDPAMGPKVTVEETNVKRSSGAPAVELKGKSEPAQAPSTTVEMIVLDSADGLFYTRDILCTSRKDPFV